MRVVVKNEQELLELAKDLLHVLINLRYWSNEWHLHHGSVLLEHKKKWEKRADALIQRLKVSRSPNAFDVHIKLENNDNVGTKD